MDSIPKGEYTEQAVSLCAPDEVARLVDLLEGIAAELSWQPGNQLRDYAAQAVHFGPEQT